MKHFVMTLLAIYAFSVTALAQKDRSGAKIEIKETTIDYGTVEAGSDPVRLINFRNVGAEALVISSVRPSCGCIAPFWSQDPIAPGQSGTIKISYTTQVVGPFKKMITIQSNDLTTPNINLTVKGVIKAKP